MSIAIGLVGGRFGLLGMDTRYMVRDRVHDSDVVSDLGEVREMMPSGPTVYATCDRRKITPTPDPGWVGCVGVAFPCAIARGVLGLRGIGDDIHRLHRVIGRSVDRALAECPHWEETEVESVNLAIIRPLRFSIELRFVGAAQTSRRRLLGPLLTSRRRRGAECYPPPGVEVATSRQIAKRTLAPAAKRGTPGERLLAAATCLEAFRETGTNAVSGTLQVGLLERRRDGVHTAQVNFVAASLLAGWTAKPLDEKLDELFGRTARDGWDPVPEWLTELPRSEAVPLPGGW